jgi:hypothetical protein
MSLAGPQISPELHRRWTVLVRAFGLAILAISLAARIVAAAEVLVPFDTRGKVLVVDAKLADRIGLFTAEHPGFSEARLFQLADSTFVLEITRRVNGGQVRDRLPLDAAGADSVRALIQARIGERAPSAKYDQEARPLLLATAAALGFGFYGWAVTDLLDVDSEKAFAAYMLTAAGTIIVPNTLTNHQNVSYPQVSLAFYGATRGIMHGLLLNEAMDPDGGDGEKALAFALGMSVGEAIIGYGAGTGQTPGQAAAIGLGGDLGLGYGLGFAKLMEEEEDEATQSLTVLGITAAGLAGGYALGRYRDYSFGDVGIMRTGGVLGAFAGWFLTEDESGSNDDRQVTASMAGTAVGLLIGDRIVDGAGYSFGQSVSVDFVTVAGALMGGSIAVLVDDAADFDDDLAPRVITLAGAIGGYAFGIGTQARGGRPAKTSSLKLGVEPRWVQSDHGSEMVPHVVARFALGANQN